ncbi:hypothetical protein LTR37_013421 [Vermiconidia calcicola]|uniref:Uncharacterized protein n=1 Tax=Vermiconidia calcicola TaxID=1690605 RepID=A0ACC3MX89_9PEZI|nr:hypothetical protein LTR37_013421 [Vermiconidia calcicola]
MSLYHEAAQILDTARKGGGSFKTIVFSKKGWKSDGKTLFALTTETAKWSEILSEVIEKSELLNIEKQNGIALPAKHGLALAITRHKARLQAELTKARLRRGLATIEALRIHVNGRVTKPSHPRWIRVNALRTSLAEQLESTFAGYRRVDDLAAVVNAGSDQRLIYLDQHVPDLVAVPADCVLTMSTAYKEGMLLLQDKASCFPAYLLNPSAAGGDVIDACAAPGNKTTHLAAILASTGERSNDTEIIACEKDPTRSSVLARMIKVAGADRTVLVKQNQDFFRLQPDAKEFKNVRSLLLDPSCSGSGIVGRDEGGVVVHMPNTLEPKENAPSRGKKRKRPAVSVSAKVEPTNDAEAEEATPELEDDKSKLGSRLASLSEFQLRMLRHAMAFTAARRITYSTCSIYAEENEHVVIKALKSEVAVERGWRIMKREEQVDGMRRWHKRGDRDAVAEVLESTDNKDISLDAGQIADACIRCIKGDDDGTMGFFVAGFVRDDLQGSGRSSNNQVIANGHSKRGNGAIEEEEEEWNGFDDDGP